MASRRTRSLGICMMSTSLVTHAKRKVRTNAEYDLELPFLFDLNVVE